jgi:hypothetical protein
MPVFATWFARSPIMPSERPLERVWTAYLVTKDALQVSQRASVKRQRHLFEDLEVLKSAPRAAESALSAARERADEFVILAMWAEFERSLIEFLEARTQSVQSISPRRLWRRLADHVTQGVERWKGDERLELLKGFVDPVQVGQAKEVGKFRDWIAHKNPRRRPSRKVEPEDTYQLLSAILAVMDHARFRGDRRQARAHEYLRAK